MKFAIFLLSASMAVSAFKTSDEVDIFTRDLHGVDRFPRDLRRLEGVEAYGLGLLHVRSIFEDKPALEVRAQWTLKSPRHADKS